MPLFERPRNDLEKFAGSPTPESVGANKDVSMGDYTNKLNVMSHNNPEIGLDEKYVEMIALKDKLTELNQRPIIQRYDFAIAQRDGTKKTITETKEFLNRVLSGKNPEATNDEIEGRAKRLKFLEDRLSKFEIDAVEIPRQNSNELEPLLATRKDLENRIGILLAALNTKYTVDESARYLN